MKKFLFRLLFIPLVSFAAITDWDYMPFISYDGQYPGEVIKEGRNFDFLLNLWENPKSLQELKLSGFDIEAVDTTRLINQGMIYLDNDIYYSAIPFIDSILL